METKKMSLANIQGKLTRAEMKNFMAGSGTNVCSEKSQAECTKIACTFQNGGTGTCGWSTALTRCVCAGA